MMPEIVLSTSSNNNLVKWYPTFSNKLSLLVIIEHGDFETVVVGRVVNGETELLVPSESSAFQFQPFSITIKTHHRGV